MFQQFQTPEYATFWHRVAAALIDSVLFMAIFCPVGLMVGVFAGLSGMEEPNEAVSALANIVINVVSTVISWLYHALLESSSWQGTVGKRVLGIRVTDLDGNRLTFGRATGRYFAKFLSNLTCLIGYIMVAFTEKKQGLHDMMAGTLVLSGTGPASGVTLDQPPPPPPSDYAQGGGYGGGYGSGGSYGSGLGN